MGIYRHTAWALWWYIRQLYPNLHFDPTRGKMAGGREVRRAVQGSSRLTTLDLELARSRTGNQHSVKSATIYTSLTAASARDELQKICIILFTPCCVG